MPHHDLPFRPAAVAGLFYPADASALRAQLSACLASAGAAPRTARPPKLLLVPHAGYVYSGDIAAQAYARLAAWRTQVTRIVLLGPAHRVPVRGLAAPRAHAFDTPLGRVPLDLAALAGLAGTPGVVFDDRPHAAEHSLEVQLPFLQTVLERFMLVPLLVGDASPEQVAQLLERLWGGDETVVVISSDLSHFLPYAAARERDADTAARIVGFDATLEAQQACGAHPVNGALLAAQRHGLVPTRLDLRNSGDTAGDRQRVVGYGAFTFEAPAARGDEDDEAEAETEATDTAQARLGRALITAARNAIASALNHPLQPDAAHPALEQIGASFVTLRSGDGALRGCVGRIEATRSLHDDVRANARSAAFDDPRFAPLRGHEWPDLRIEVSLLDEPVPLAPHDEAAALQALQPGIDGVLLEWRGRRATFLPQVWEQLAEPADFIAALKRKAGLPADFWADDLRLSRYRVQKFAEERA